MPSGSQYVSSDIATYGSTGKNDDNNTKKVRSMLEYDLTGIHGMPFQFLGSVDPRLPATSSGTLDCSNDSFGIGNIYAEKIVARMPLLFLVPCKQKFMEGFTKEEKSAAINALLGGSTDPINFERSGRYYSVEFDYASYYRHVNTMCSELAYFMNVQNEYIPTNGKKKQVKDIDWGEQKNATFSSFYAGNKSVVFYVDGMDNITDNFSNSTTESSLASTINSFSDTAKEIKFFLGTDSVLGQAAENMGDLFGNAIETVGGGIADFFASGMLSDLMNTGVHTIINGGKLVFPKIWGDSSYDRSYNFEIKLRSPDHDNLSIFLNIMVPLIHLICLTIPKTMEDGGIIDPNGYISPYLCKAYMKGMFNIDMGIITNMTVSKGATAQWNDNGVPTQIDVSISIEDLYSGLFMTAEGENGGLAFNSLKRIAAIASNTAMMDYLSNLGGLNVGDTEINRRMNVFNALLLNEMGRIPSANLWRNFDQGLNNILAKAYRTF